jgi:ferric-dicitrate binding protein FerR (iron transport regulator)
MNRIREEKPRQTKVFSLPTWTRTVAAVAAILVVAFTSGMLLTTQNFRNNGKDAVTFRLPDQSRVILASESSVRFNKLFLNRKVNLKGKAYFEVAKGSKFQVGTSKGGVEVLGTRFTVDDRNDQMQVVCFEGKVKATFKNEDVVLVPGAGIRFTPDQKQIPLNEKEEYPGFARFSKEYNNAELETVIQDVETFFGVQIDSRVKQPRYFSGTLNTGNLETALSIFTVSLQLEYKLQSDQSIIIY